MSRKKANPDLILRLQGLSVPDGALGGDDLLQLGKLLKGLGTASPELEGGFVSQLHHGSTRPSICFPRRQEVALPGQYPVQSSLLGLFKDGGYSDDGWKVPKDVRDCLRHWAQKNISVSVRIPRDGEKAYSFKFTPQKVKVFSEKIAEEPTLREFKGKLRALDGADNEFELHFNNQKLICPFPRGTRPSGLYYEKFVEVAVWVKSRPTQGSWKAVSTESLKLLPEAPHLELGDYQKNIVLPAIKVPGGFHLDSFFLGALPSDIEALCQSLAIPDC